MRQSWNGALVVCPYYMGETRNALCCRGPAGAHGLYLTFETKAEKEGFERMYCARVDSFRDCPVCRMLEESYDDGGDRQ